MFDIHCHILPNIDDGARDFEDCMEMIKMQSKSGVKAICATPHFIEGDSDVHISVITERIHMVNQELKKRNIEAIILPGMEVFLTPNLVELYEEKRIITLNNKNYLLIELPMFESRPSYLDDILFSLELKGIHPIIAHPERYRQVQQHPNTVYKLIESGCLIQVNSGSITGEFGKSVQKTANTLLEHNMVHFVASDCHSSKARMSLLNESYDMVAKKFGKNYAKKLYVDNPRDVLDGKEIEVEDAEKVKKKKFIIF